MSYRRRRTIFGGNSGYQDYSKSNRAVEAEERGLRNKSQMDREFLDEVNAILEEEGAKKVTLSEIKRELKNIDADEWHHTSMYGNRTNYYSPETIADYFGLNNQEEREEQKQKEREKEVRDENFRLLVEKFKKDFPKYEIYCPDVWNSSITIVNPEDKKLYTIELYEFQTKQEIKNIIKSKIDDEKKYIKRKKELSDYLKKIGSGLKIFIHPQDVMLCQGDVWSYCIYIDDGTKNSEIKKEIKRILEPYFQKKKKFENLIKKYKFIEDFYYSPYTDGYWIKFIKPFKKREYSYKGITNDYFEIDYRNVSFDDVKNELNELKKEFKYL